MRSHSRALTAFLVALVGFLATAATASFADDGRRDRQTNVDGTIWVANRGVHTIQGFDARTGGVVGTIAMTPGSQPGDLAYARGKLYVAEEFASPPAIAIVDPETGVVTKRISMAPLSRPHHVHTTRRGNLVAFGLYGTDDVAVVDTRTDTLLGRWDTNGDPNAESGRAHAGVFSPRGRILYVASDASNEIVALDPRTGAILWSLTVPGAHELAVTRNGKTAYVTRRTANRVCVLDLRVHDACTDVLTLGLPDTLRLAAGDRLLTITLRTMPARRWSSTRGRSSTSSFGSARRSRPTRSPGISGRHETAATRSRRSKVEPVRASRSSTTGTGTESCERSTIRVGRTESTWRGLRTTKMTAGTRTTRGMR